MLRPAAEKASELLPVFCSKCSQHESVCVIKFLRALGLGHETAHNHNHRNHGVCADQTWSSGTLRLLIQTMPEVSRAKIVPTPVQAPYQIALHMIWGKI